MAYEKPLPDPDENTRPFFDALTEHRLLLQYFPSADHYQFPYSDRCYKDWSTDWEWRESAGSGEVYSWVRMHQLYHPSWKEDLPYTLAVVQLDEGPRMNTNLVNVAPDEIRVGMRVQVVFDDVTEDVTLPKFEPS